jgi:hypothetical protein
MVELARRGARFRASVPLDLARKAAKAEPVHWSTPAEGEPFLVDRYGRPLAVVKTELERALDLAERLEVIVTETEKLTRGRIFGPTLERRLRTSIETILKCAEWNLRYQRALEGAWLQEQEKLARWKQEKGCD